MKYMRSIVTALCCGSLIFITAQHMGRSGYLYDMTILGFVNMADGLGRLGADVIDCVGPDIKTSMLYTRRTNVARGTSTLVQKAMRISGVDQPGKVVILSECISFPPSDTVSTRPFWSRFGVKEHDDQQIRIAYSMFESSRIAKEWVGILNTSFDCVVVPDPFLIQVYQDSGVKIPIFCVPLCRDFQPFLQQPLKQERASPMVFASFGSCNKRKNPYRLVQAFYKAFGHSHDVKLRLSWRNCDSAYRDRMLKFIKQHNITNIECEENVFSEDSYVHRLQAVDCYVNLAVGEGFSLQPREAMALGIPVIVSDNSAQHTICQSGLVRAVRSTVAIPADYGLFQGVFGNFYDCEEQDVVEALLDVYNHYDLYLRRAPEAREWARMYDNVSIRDAYVAFIKPKKIYRGSENTIMPDGIMIADATLFTKYANVFSQQATVVP